MEDLGNLKYFLGIEVVRSRHVIFLFKWKYVLDLLKETRMLGCKVVDNPVEQHKNLEERDEVLCWITIGWQVNIFVMHSSRHCLCNKCSEPVYAFSPGLSYGSSLQNISIFEVFTRKMVVVCLII